MTPAQSGAVPASTAEAFRKERRETSGEVGWTTDCMVGRNVAEGGINGRDKRRVDFGRLAHQQEIIVRRIFPINHTHPLRLLPAPSMSLARGSGRCPSPIGWERVPGGPVRALAKAGCGMVTVPSTSRCSEVWKHLNRRLVRMVSAMAARQATRPAFLGRGCSRSAHRFRSR